MQSSNKKKFIGIVVAVVVAIVVSIGVRLVIAQFAGPSTSEAVAKAVDELNSTTTLPQQIDEITTLESVKAEEESIHYSYTLEGADPSSVNDQSLEDLLLSQVCGADETKELLEQDVSVRYTYEVAETGDQYDLTFTKADC